MRWVIAGPLIALSGGGICGRARVCTGLHAITNAFPKMTIVVSEVDAGLNSAYHIVPGIGRATSSRRRTTALEWLPAWDSPNTP